MVDSAVGSSRYSRRVFWFVAGLLVFRLIHAALFATSPAGDEAYYWDWGRHPDIGYYSKPPMIAWIYAFVDAIGGGSLFAIRATAVLLGTSALLLLHRLVKSLFDAETAWVAILIAGTAPANSVLSFFLTIDAPLIVFWTLALWMFWRVIERKGGAASWVILLLALGAGHLTKQMMMIFPILALLFLVLTPSTRMHLRRPVLWIVLFGSFFSLLPPLLWNAQNEWITFTHTKHHFVEVSDGGNVVLERLEDFFSFLATQLGVLGPGTAVVLFPICLLALRHIRKLGPEFRLLLVFGGIPLAGMLLMAMRQGLQPNWPAVFYVSCMGLTAAWYTGKIHPRIPPQGMRTHLPVSVTINIALMLFFYFGSVVFQGFGKEGHKADPNRRLLGHSEVAAGFEQIRKNQKDADELFLIALGHRDVASHLAFALPDQPKLYRWAASGQIVSQYEVWNNPEEDGLVGKDALILVPMMEKMPAPLARAFAKTQKLGEFDVPFGYDRSRHFTVFRGYDLKKWPPLSSPLEEESADTPP